MKNFRKILFVICFFALVSCSKSNVEIENEKLTQQEVQKEKEKVTKELDETVGKFKKITDFNLSFVKKEDTKRDLIFAKNETYDFSIYTLGGDFTAEIGGEKISFKDAMKEKLNVDDILNKLSTDVSRGFAKEVSFKDGGTVLITYPEFSVVKFNTLDGRFDMYFTSIIENFSRFNEIVTENEESQK